MQVLPGGVCECAQYGARIARRALFAQYVGGQFTEMQDLIPLVELDTKMDKVRLVRYLHNLLGNNRDVYPCLLHIPGNK